MAKQKGAEGLKGFCGGTFCVYRGPNPGFELSVPATENSKAATENPKPGFVSPGPPFAERVAGSYFRPKSAGTSP